MAHEPVMEIEPGLMRQQRSSKDMIDVRSGWIVAREEAFSMPTIERERILGTRLSSRVPALGAAFVSSGLSRLLPLTCWRASASLSRWASAWSRRPL